jgi:cell division protein FtsW (lipid II flippase)
MRRSAIVLAPLPALAIGVLVMRQAGVSSAIWGQQLAAGLTLMILCAGVGFAPRRPRIFGSWGWAISGVAALLLLVGSLAQPGVEGVRRWVPIGPLHVHAGFVALPVLLVVVGRIMRADRLRPASWLVPVATVIAALVLTLQPDPSQASAFGLAVLVLLFGRRSPTRIEWLAAGAVVLSALAAWTRPDPLAAVPYVEGIVTLAGSLGTGWLVASLLALALLPMPFVVDALRRTPDTRPGIALAIYFAAVSSAPFVGPYPVPVLGFGLSPIIGYFAVLGWVILRNQAA